MYLSVEKANIATGNQMNGYTLVFFALKHKADPLVTFNFSFLLNASIYKHNCGNKAILILIQLPSIFGYRNYLFTILLRYIVALSFQTLVFFEQLSLKIALHKFER